MSYTRVMSGWLRAVLLLGLLGTVLIFPTQVGATLAGCRSDPLVYLSNGTAVEFNADIDALPTSVASVDFVIHGPSNVRMLLGVATPGVLFPERFEYRADAPPGQYITETLVRTRGAPVAVTSNSNLVKVKLLGGLGVALMHGSTSGWSGQTQVTVLEP